MCNRSSIRYEMIFIELLFAVYKTSRSREVERNFHQSMFFSLSLFYCLLFDDDDDGEGQDF